MGNSEEHLERNGISGQGRFWNSFPYFRAEFLQLWNAIGAITYPEPCPLCSVRRSLEGSRFAVCVECMEKLVEKKPACLRCGAPHSEAIPPLETCMHCKSESWAFRRIHALGKYGGLLRTTVILMKRPYYEALSLGMGRVLGATLRSKQEVPWDLILPTPQHWLRRATRRCNSAELLAESIAVELRRPYFRSWLRRNKQTQKQGMLGGEQRRINVKGAFSMAPWAQVQGKRVLLVDDILTSGSTANEMTKAILASGAEWVDVAVLARSIG